LTLLRNLLLLCIVWLPGQAAATEAKQRPPVLDLPLKCVLGSDCFIQHYMDMDPTDNARDYQCGTLTRDGHQGSDFRLRTVADMHAGIPVIAAADGKVLTLRDGVPDQYFSDYAEDRKKEINAIGLGNVVILDHGDDWTTFYAHMKKDTIRVEKGDRVRKGDVLGMVGMSGLTDFPHVHFELRHRNIRIDPFSGLQPEKCGVTGKSHWSDLAAPQLVYRPTGFLATGFSETRPMGRRDLESGDKAETELNPMAPTLFFWTYYFGSQEGDKVTLKITGPDGVLITEQPARNVTRNQFTRYLFVGTQRPQTGWKSGIYMGEVTLERAGEHLTDSAVITIR
jgi:hypothetical protein